MQFGYAQSFRRMQLELIKWTFQLGHSGTRLRRSWNEQIIDNYFCSHQVNASRSQRICFPIWQMPSPPLDQGLRWQRGCRCARTVFMWSIWVMERMSPVIFEVSELPETETTHHQNTNTSQGSHTRQTEVQLFERRLQRREQNQERANKFDRFQRSDLCNINVRHYCSRKQYCWAAFCAATNTWAQKLSCRYKCDDKRRICMWFWGA